MSETTPLVTASREAVEQVIYDVAVDHPMWIGDDGQPLDYLPEREARIADFVREAADALLASGVVRAVDGLAEVLAVREQALTKAARTVDALLLRVKGFGEPWDRGYAQGVQASAYAIRELRALTTPTDPSEA